MSKHTITQALCAEKLQFSRLRLKAQNRLRATALKLEAARLRLIALQKVVITRTQPLTTHQLPTAIED